ncbi:hypothetical protein DPMN_004353 [Dreissena polymorpha]|uniref:Uncharacterized protein n=1 Tax=Dreissena polymorpha TaxID=45954 RepID=A0A9D4RTH4_DREPO|nr:hypothetical protein DPMN_004353 [Dreissena polymorpha]
MPLHRCHILRFLPCAWPRKDIESSPEIAQGIESSLDIAQCIYARACAGHISSPEIAQGIGSSPEPTQGISRTFEGHSQGIGKKSRNCTGHIKSQTYAWHIPNLRKALSSHKKNLRRT